MVASNVGSPLPTSSPMDTCLAPISPVIGAFTSQ